jgi:hypothetical protein
LRPSPPRPTSISILSLRASVRGQVVAPEDLGCDQVIMALLAYAGDTQAGERAVAPFRALATPLAGMVRPMPYPEIYPPEEAGYHPTAAALQQGDTGAYVGFLGDEGQERVHRAYPGSWWRTGTSRKSLLMSRLLGGRGRSLPQQRICGRSATTTPDSAGCDATCIRRRARAGVDFPGGRSCRG